MSSKSNISKYTLGTSLFSITHQYTQSTHCKWGVLVEANTFLMHSAPSILFYSIILTYFYYNFSGSEFNNMKQSNRKYQGRLDVPYIHLFGYICWSSRMTALKLHWLSIIPCTCKDGISASTICYLYRYILAVWCIGRFK